MSQNCRRSCHLCRFEFPPIDEWHKRRQIGDPPLPNEEPPEEKATQISKEIEHPKETTAEEKEQYLLQVNPLPFDSEDMALEFGPNWSLCGSETMGSWKDPRSRWYYHYITQKCNTCPFRGIPMCSCCNWSCQIIELYSCGTWSPNGWRGVWS